MTEPLCIHLVCSTCGNAEIFAVWAGAEAVIECGIVVVRSQRDRALCLQCWRKQFIHEREQP